MIQEMDDTRLEMLPNVNENTARMVVGAAQALQKDPELARVHAIWPTLLPAVRGKIIEIVNDFTNGLLHSQN